MKQKVTRWIYPLFLGLIIFNCLRLATDLLKENGFWAGSVRLNIISQFSIIFMCYVFDFLSRQYLLKKKDQPVSLAKEYIIVVTYVFVTLNLIAYTGEIIGIYPMGNGLTDYIVINVIALPLFLLYYTMIRSEIMNKKLSNQTILLEKIKSKQFETELDYLKAQYHPHFLFNALNTVYFQIDDTNKSAKHTVELLSELLRYQLYDVSKVVTMRQEIGFINNYMKFQQLRISEKLKLDIYFDQQLDTQLIHPLLFQPLLENAFKYVGGAYSLKVDLRLENEWIVFTVENSVSPLLSTGKHKSKGIGIDNLKRRLALLYPDKYTLIIQPRESSFFAALKIKTETDEH